MIPRSAGLLLHPTSLPGPFGLGDLGPGVERFLDFAREGGQSIWQVLPLGPAASGNSPYAALSTRAGNPILISPERLAEDGLADEPDLRGATAPAADRVHFPDVARWKSALLRSSWQRFRERGGPLREAFAAFRESPEQSGWLEDWALFMAIKESRGLSPWTSWEPDLKRRGRAALARASESLRGETDYQAYLQFLFFRQWHRVREAARARGVALFGDVPIYAAMDSVDVWTRPELFQLDGEREPLAVAGVPPDYFSATGQLWGNPLYRWEQHEKDGFAWWIDRLRAELRSFDLVRIDHFRAFASYWAVPRGAATAVDGRWETGPGMALFRALASGLGTEVRALPLVAEDLGIVTDDVRALLRETGLPGMRVMQFGFTSEDSEHAPARYPVHCVAYTGTHDNDTSRGWFESLPRGDERARLLAALGRADAAPDGRDVAWAMIRALYASAAERVVVPIQDVLGLGSDARMNTPSVAAGNWEFRVRGGALVPELSARLRREADIAGRAAGARIGA